MDKFFKLFDLNHIIKYFAYIQTVDMSAENANLESQNDELEALSSIYGEDFKKQDNSMFDLRVCCDDEKWWAVTISALLPPSYPAVSPPMFEIHTECLSMDELEFIYQQLDILWHENVGSNILYIWVERIREMLVEKYEAAKLFIESSEEEKKRERALTELMREECKEIDGTVPVPLKESKKLETPVPNILSGDTVTLKKSTFQGHAAIVYTVDEVKAVLSKLKENKKVSQATHNIVAYRLSGVNESCYIQDYADDGEVNAGGRLLHLLQIMDVKNVVVIVSRWYGGILLGPDRFRLINNSAREVIVSLGVYTPKQEKGKQKKRR